MAGHHSKNNRILDLYQRLCAGRLIRKGDEARRFGVDERSIQRDVDDIRAFLEEQAAETGEGRTVVYDRRKKGFLLQGGQSPLMSNSEILAVSKILLESRAFSRQEMSRVLDKLISGCVPQSNMKLVSDLLANEKFHYVELTHPAPIQDKLWDMGSAIQQRTLMELEYQRQGQASSPVTRVVEPVSILFSEYYFYLNAYIVEMDQRGRYVHKYDYPAIFRIDRIEDYRTLPQRFHLPYANRFQEGEFRKRIQFMYPGRLQRIRVHVPGLLLRIDEYRHRLLIADGITGGGKGQIGRKHHIPRLNSDEPQGQMDGRRSGAQRHRITASRIFGHFLLKRVHIRPERRDPVGLKGFVDKPLLIPMHGGGRQINSLFSHVLFSISVRLFLTKRVCGCRADTNPAVSIVPEARSSR